MSHYTWRYSSNVFRGVSGGDDGNSSLLQTGCADGGAGGAGGGVPHVKHSRMQGMMVVKKADRRKQEARRSIG